MTRTKTRWGCFFPDLTRLASSSSITNLPCSYCRFKMKNQAKKQEIFSEQRRIFPLYSILVLWTTKKMEIYQFYWKSIFYLIGYEQDGYFIRH